MIEIALKNINGSDVVRSCSSISLNRAMKAILNAIAFSPVYPIVRSVKASLLRR